MVRWYERSDWTDAWSRVHDFVDVDLLEGSSIAAADALERGAIRRFCESLEMDCPLFYDLDAAHAQGYPDLLAPFSGVSQAWIDGGSWHPGDPTEFPSPSLYDHPKRAAGFRLNAFDIGAPETEAATQTDLSIRYLGAACAGDRLAQRALTLRSVTPKETSIGRGAFLTFENHVVTQDGTLVAVVTRTVFRYQPTGSRTTSNASVEPATETVTPGSNVDWSKQLTFEDVHVGDELPPLAINLTLSRLVMQAGSDRDFNPIHHSEVAARDSGAPHAYANNVFCQGMWERSVREYIGLAGRIEEIRSFRMRKFNLAGHQLVTSGRVLHTSFESGRFLVTLEMLTRDETDITVGPGQVTVSLPGSRAST